MIYLASPYSHPDPAVRENLVRMACRATARLMRAGQTVFSPIAHSHPIARFGLPTDWTFWERQDREHLERCDELVVLLLEGCPESRGVRAEIQLAESLGKPVRYLIPEGVLISPTLARFAKKDGV